MLLSILMTLVAFKSGGEILIVSPSEVLPASEPSTSGFSRTGGSIIFPNGNFGFRGRPLPRLKTESVGAVASTGADVGAPLPGEFGVPSHTGRKGLLHEPCVIRCQAVLGLEDGDRAKPSVLFAWEGFDLLDQLSADRGRLLNAELFPDGRNGRASGSGLVWSAARRGSIGPGTQAGGGWIAAVRLIVGEIWRV
jgi:hypothetical protein